MIKHHFLDKIRDSIRDKNDTLVKKRVKWIKANPYYYKLLLKSLKFIIEKESRVLHIRCGTGYILDELEPKYGVGIDDSELQIKDAEDTYKHLHFIAGPAEDINLDDKFDYILITSIEDIVDIKAVLDGMKRCCYPHTRIILVSYNYLWQPLINIAEKFKMKIEQKLHNWLSLNDIYNLLTLSDYAPILTRKVILYPFRFPILAYLLNNFIARLPFFRHFSLINLTIARPLWGDANTYSVSVIIPCKNEAGNIEEAVKRIPLLGKHTEIIFCDDRSTDGTAEMVKRMMVKYPDKDIKLYNGPGICKAENVWVGFDNAQGDILMILDADLTVLPEELPYFYEAISKRQGEFINGSRLVYPMHGNAMRFFNVLGNKFFSMFFSYILDVTIKDTLCGTKVLWKRDYERIKKLRGSWGIVDKWGDYELIFGASKTHLKIIDLPVHYYERTYGETKMTNLLKNGWTMLRMSMAALFKIKFY